MELFNLRRAYVVFLLWATASSCALAANELPPILDYYPVCHYQTLDTITVKIRIAKKGGYGDVLTKIEKSPLQAKTTELLKNLQAKAKSQNAEAIILLARDLKQGSNSRKKGTTTLSYRAELIHQCANLAADRARPTKFNQQGQKRVMDWSKKTKVGTERKIVFSNSRKTLNFPVIETSEVSFSKGIYGVKLGFSVQQVRKILGDPSVELAILNDEFVLGYGRRHWFHFQGNKLVKVDAISSPLNQNILNRVPFREFFDDSLWKINGKVSSKKSLAEVSAGLAINSLPSDRNELVLENNEQLLRLHFDVEKDFKTEQRHYSLDGFSLQLSSYKKHPVRHFNQTKQQNRIIEQTYLQLQQEQEQEQEQDIELSELKQQLGESVGKINISAIQELILYNPFLLLESKRASLAKIILTESYIKNYKQNKPALAAWNIVGIKQGQNLDKMIKLLPDAYGWGDKLEFEVGLYQASLMFAEEKGQKLLYEMEIEL